MNALLNLNQQIQVCQQSKSAGLQTTEFWRHATKQLDEALADNRISEFRSNPACLSFFVPTYGQPGNGLNNSQIDIINSAKTQASAKQKAQITDMISGIEAAKADQRIISAISQALQLKLFSEFSESTIGSPKEQFVFQGQRYSRASQNYILGLLFLLMHRPDASIKKVIEIGGGFGSLGEILHQSKLNIDTYINFDIAPTCLFSDYYLSETIPTNRYNPISDHAWRDNMDIEHCNGFYTRPNYDVEKLTGSIDLLVNYHSFQEMEPHVVEEYSFHIERWRPKYLLLRNIREGKQLSTPTHAGVKEPIKTNNYLSWFRSYSLVSINTFEFGNITADGFHSELLLMERDQEI